MSKAIVEGFEPERAPSPATPEPPDEPVTPDMEVSGRLFNDLDDQTPTKRGKKRHRRSKGKKKKQKTHLMITNEDGTNSTAAGAGVGKQQRKVFLRPSNNPLQRAPRNSTQFIMDDHENSNLFWNFDSLDQDDENTAVVGGDRGNDSHISSKAIQDDAPAMASADDSNEKFDDDSFWTAFSERDFECVYETAHTEEVYSWGKNKIIDEIAVLEMKQKRLIDMLSQIDPLIYLQKLQHELLALQEQNRQLKLVNIAEKLLNQKGEIKGGSSSPRVPDSTTGEESKDTFEYSEEESEESEEDSDAGGCSSGCCLALNCNQESVEERLQELEDELESSEPEPGEAIRKANLKSSETNEYDDSNQNVDPDNDDKSRKAEK